jgi:hypothetical protein
VQAHFDWMQDDGGHVNLYHTNYFGAPPRNAWCKVDCYKKLSTPSLMDGVIDYRLNTEQKTNNTAMTRAAGASFLMDTVLLGGMDGSDANHDYDVYIDDVYIDNTRARVEICDAPTGLIECMGKFKSP